MHPNEGTSFQLIIPVQYILLMICPVVAQSVYPTSSFGSELYFSRFPVFSLLQDYKKALYFYKKSESMSALS
jgi:hypothetical protein